MRILIDIGHPAQVHFFKNIIYGLKQRGHEVKITLRNRDVAKYLLDTYGLNYEVIIDKHYKGLLRKAIGTLYIDYKLYKIAKDFCPDILIAETSYISHIGKLIKKPSILFCNNENATLENLLFLPFADTICTPKCFEKEFNPKRHVQYDGYYFLPYLHPKYFKPNPDVLEELNINKNEKFTLIRLRTYDAAHDVGQKNISQGIEDLIHDLEKHSKIFIKSDVKLNIDLAKYELPPIEKLHDLLYFANMYIGDGISMAAEAAILGTPSVLVSTLHWGYIKELRDRYGLLYTCGNIKEAKPIITALIKNQNLKNDWAKKRGRMLSEKEDLVEFVIELLEGYQKRKTGDL